MASHAVPHAKVVQTMRALLKGRSKAEAERLKRFARVVLANLPPDDMAREAEEDLAGAIRCLLGFAGKRVPGEAKVRLYNPRRGRDGWDSTHTVVEMVNDDMPFLVDSVTAELARHDLEVHLIIHPIFSVKRDKAGSLKDIKAPGDHYDESQSESIMQLWISEAPQKRHAEIRKGLEQVLSDVRAAVEDWRAMRQRARDLIEELERKPPPLAKAEVAEALAFLEWLDADNFTFLGFREYRYTGKKDSAVSRIVPRSGLGVLRSAEVSVFDGLRNLSSLPADVQEFIRQPVLLRITKANRRSTVHRTAYMDTIALKSFDARGRVVGERLFVGLFTSSAYSTSPREIPLLRHKVEATLKRAGFAPNTHDGKALVHILDAYPRDELFQIGEDDLYRTAIGILHLQERRRLALFVRRDPFERFISAFIYVPRDRYDTNLRLKLQAILARAYEGEVTAFNTYLSDAAQARLHLIVRTKPGELPPVDEAALEAELGEAARSWIDQLEQALMAAHGESDGYELFKRYQQAFPPAYQDHFTAEDAVADIEHMDAALGETPLAMQLYRPKGATGGRIAFKVYVADEPIPLSDILPVLENMGLKVLSEVPYAIEPQSVEKNGEKRTCWLHNFGMLTRDDGEVEVPTVRDDFHEVFARVWSGRMENDGFNRLVLRANLGARDILMLRAYARYLRQAKAPFSQGTIEHTLATNPAITRLLVAFFKLRFEIDGAEDREAVAKEVKQELTEALENVSNLDEDRVVRRYLNLMQATLRTNFYQAAEGLGPEEKGEEKAHLSFKFDSKMIEDLPQPRPYREIFVYSARVEGVHLRFGPVARGGLRWSDRRDDFRTEILGLVKAQQVKNAVIVPVGSKGGFVLKKAPPPAAGREVIQAEGIYCYKTFLRGLLDITDNLVKDKVVPPRQVVRYDGDDPYLVVAADKGTATFSDIANGVSQDYGFWLGDAFASGGSAGYDHKAMGITARGAWESVKRHFRELGKDCQKEDFTVVGCGDMSGDVFGNGMLLSKHIRLLAAFDHRDIFVDPDPDAARSFKERKRLFEMGRSSWQDYDKRLISKGGGVFDRKAKSIKVTPEMRSALGLTADSLTPNELIRQILLAPAELLWFGGIGTYVKASQEGNRAVGDRANDAVRVNGRSLRVKVVGEGANLGMTQLGRIEFSLSGGHCNTDSIDNSAGVDCSDHEVNIKILTGALEQKKKLDRKKRDKLLSQMTEEVAGLVLRDNYLQTQAISATERMGAHLLDRHARFMRSLEKAGKLDRALEDLPNDEVVAERLAARRGLQRPELAILLCYAKIVLYDEILASDLPDDPALEDDLQDYFPEPLKKGYPNEIQRHRLRREIIATTTTNDIINRMGVTFVSETHERTGLPSSDIARAYLAAREIFSAREICLDIEAQDGVVPADQEYASLVEVARLVERATAWLLRHHGQGLAIDKAIAHYRPGVKSLTERLETVVTDRHRGEIESRARPAIEGGMPKALAQRIAAGPWLMPLLDVVRIAEEHQVTAEEAAPAFYVVGEHFGFDWLRQAAGKLSTDTAWDKLAVSAVVEELGQQQADMTARILRGRGKEESLEEALGSWTESRRPLVARAEQLMGELGAMAQPTLAMLTVASRQLRSLLAG